MAPLPPIANVLKVEVLGTTSAGRNWANILHFRWSGTAPAPSVCASIAQQVTEAFVSGFQSLMTEYVQITGCQVTDLTSDTSGQGSYETSVSGTLTGDTIPAGSSMLAQYTQTLRYRGGHPRTYLVVGSGSELAGVSDWGGSFVTSVQDAFTTFLAAVSDISEGGCSVGAQVAVSYRSGNAPRPDPIALPLTFTGCSNVVASQRRRTRRRS
jgi:hypothetical protein